MESKNSKYFIVGCFAISALMPVIGGGSFFWWMEIIIPSFLVAVAYLASNSKLAIIGGAVGIALSVFSVLWTWDFDFYYFDIMLDDFVYSLPIIV